MASAMWAGGAFTIVATANQLGSVLIAIGRCRRMHAATAQAQTALGLLGLTRFLKRRGFGRARQRSGQIDTSGVSIVRPICGIEPHGEETLRSAFLLAYPNYEIIFCAAAANHPAAPLVRPP